jgi:hypothetical protein
VATELLNIMTWVLELLAIGNRHTPETRLRLSHRATVADVQRRMDEAEAGSAERRGAVWQAALELFQKHCCLRASAPMKFVAALFYRTQPGDY